MSCRPGPLPEAWGAFLAIFRGLRGSWGRPRSSPGGSRGRSVGPGPAEFGRAGGSTFGASVARGRVAGTVGVPAGGSWGATESERAEGATERGRSGRAVGGSRQTGGVTRAADDARRTDARTGVLAPWAAGTRGEKPW